MNRLYTLLLLLLPCTVRAQYFHYMHTYDTTGDVVRNILLLPDGDLLLNGSYLHYDNNKEDAFWLRISSNGDSILSKHIIHTDTAAWYMGYSGNTKALSNGGYVLPYTWFKYNADPNRWQNMATLVFLDQQLDTVAVKRYTDSAQFSDGIYDCAILPDGSFLIAGLEQESYIDQQTEYWGLVMRIDAQGGLVWKHTYQKEPGKNCHMQSVQPLDNNRTLIGGASVDIVPIGFQNYLRNKPWFVIIDNSTGDILKDTLYIQGYSYWGVAYKDMNGGFYHVGAKDSVVSQNPEDAQNFPAYVAHLDTNFKIDWLTSMPYSFQPSQKMPWRIRQLQNGDYLVSGFAIQDVTNFGHGWVARISSAGAILWSKYYYSQANQYAYLADFVERPDGNIILCGWTRNDTIAAWQGQNIWLLGLYASGEILTGTAYSGNASVKTMEFSIYPNPASGSFYLDVPEPGEAEVYDMSGKQIATYHILAKGKTQLPLDDKIPPGNYLLQFTGRESGMVAGKQLVKR